MQFHRDPIENRVGADIMGLEAQALKYTLGCMRRKNLTIWYLVTQRVVKEELG